MDTNVSCAAVQVEGESAQTCAPHHSSSSRKEEQAGHDREGRGDSSVSVALQEDEPRRSGSRGAWVTRRSSFRKWAQEPVSGWIRVLSFRVELTSHRILVFSCSELWLDRAEPCCLRCVHTLLFDEHKTSCELSGCLPHNAEPHRTQASHARHLAASQSHSAATGLIHTDPHPCRSASVRSTVPSNSALTK